MIKFLTAKVLCYTVIIKHISSQWLANNKSFVSEHLRTYKVMYVCTYEITYNDVTIAMYVYEMYIWSKKVMYVRIHIHT